MTELCHVFFAPTMLGRHLLRLQHTLHMSCCMPGARQPGVQRSTANLLL